MNKTVSITTLPSATGFGPGNSLVGVSNGEASLFPYDLIATGGTGSGATGETGATGSTGATGATGATGSVETTDRLISTNNLEVVLDSQGTLNTPLLLPITFTAVCDEEHMIDPVVFGGSDWWEFEVAFQVNPNGTVETMIDNIFPILTNPGYESGYTFRFTEADHGIPDFIFDIQLTDVVIFSPDSWSSALSFTPPPEYPSTIESLGAIKITSNSNSIILGTDGKLAIPNNIEFPDFTIQTTAYTGTLDFISSGPTAPGSAVVAHQTKVDISFSDGVGVETAWSFDTTALTFPDDTLQNTAWTGGRVVEVPVSSAGYTGDLMGDLAFDSSYLYYCTVNYDTPQYFAVNLISANGVGSGYLVPDYYAAPQIGWQVIYGGNSSIISGVFTNNPGFYTVFVIDPLVIPTDAEFIWGPVPLDNIWKRIGWSNDIW